jgi:VIT1/CCC1 family predicted Fe2+/Mn2+ transporter
MPTTLHVERHFTGKEIVRDVVIGMADGLTVPFALAAGLSGAVKSTNVVVIAGLAEIAAGSIAMGLGGYLAARSDAEHYDSEREREVREVRELPDEEEREVREVLHEWGMAPEESGPVVQALRKRPTAWVDFMMRFELGLEKPDPGRAVRSAGTIAASYVVGGLIPLFPYMVIPVANRALMLSVVVTLIALGVFGYVKGRFTGLQPVRSASQTMVIGALAAGAAFLLARIIS